MSTYGKMIGIMMDENDVDLVKNFADKLPNYHVGKVLADTCVKEYMGKKVTMEARHQNESDVSIGGVRVKVYCPTEASEYYGSSAAREYFKFVNCDFAEQIVAQI